MIRLDSLGLLLGRLGRDWRGWLFGFSLLFSGFGLLWALVMRRTLEQVAPFFRLMASQSGLGVVGYGCGTWQMVRRDLPVPL